MSVSFESYWTFFFILMLFYHIHSKYFLFGKCFWHCTWFHFSFTISYITTVTFTFKISFIKTLTESHNMYFCLYELTSQFTNQMLEKCHDSWIGKLIPNLCWSHSYVFIKSAYPSDLWVDACLHVILFITFLLNQIIQIWNHQVIKVTFS